MTVLNRTNDGLFNVLIILVRALIRFGPRSREDLILACGGEFFTEENNQLGQTLTRWTQLGLFDAENGKVIVSPAYLSELGKTADDAESRLPKVVRSIALLPENNERFWDGDGAKCADLSRGMAWMLAQDIYRLDSSTKSLMSLETLQLEDSTNQKIFQNERDLPALREWMIYLGFARDGMQWVVDPTDALRDALPAIYGSHHELSAPTFVARAATVLPVLDGGAYRLQVEAALNDSAWPRLRVGLLSSALSRAIQRLDREGAITLANRSDTEGVVTLTGSNARTWRDVSHVAMAPAGKAR
ncbi:MULTISPECIES: protein DpdG [unclassified Mesorhizobium]|uniref:protein DpdG n=1 Tax=unclassified Mesorhizobium TaxID=325217 RepID=UPI00112A0968|nr:MULTISPECIES: protein DpdG [unclassified Mesorhizobium]TPK52912.1 hypothetical protein FJ550_14535 [Mesorhizobium sp. B2-5-2]TPL21344.1 hypothetical protein FJ946_21445 [Mesorhizobium sp. B2-4-7]TPL42957.1 hypothetical protein FJ961_09785 [Mesorhizobium sp. B2-4-5]TPM76914.1 hypothetical protein FJ968_04160 [Mesorhizobium sp. B2-1-6]TPN80054.1 hypothetical protein FJ985_02145 [Mesorhizobium sp. B1-1-2]